MRRLLKFLNFIKRAQTDPKPNTAARTGTPPVPAREKQRDDSKPAQAPELAAVVAAKKRHHWEAPELEGPEFGGLIERRGTDTRGLMPEPWTPEPHPEFKPRGPSQLGSDPGHVNMAQDAETDADAESTGVFLAALDNSAITLADSGLFRISEKPEESPEDDESFDPYDHS